MKKSSNSALLATIFSQPILWTNSPKMVLGVIPFYGLIAAMTFFFVLGFTYWLLEQLETPSSKKLAGE